MSEKRSLYTQMSEKHFLSFYYTHVKTRSANRFPTVC